ncbi:hypothetical protein HYX16_03400 [Candidatus Woesearchaeota archaeon]|nr:hypothetical protein [Candidatus Woesearchaeota archaeon]
MKKNKSVSKLKQEEIAQRQMKKMEKGFHMGKILIENRNEIYDDYLKKKFKK